MMVRLATETYICPDVQAYLDSMSKGTPALLEDWDEVEKTLWTCDMPFDHKV